MPRYPSKIISGGQTGADLGGLVGAEACKIPTGGTAAKGYRTEKGNRPDILRDRFHLREHVSRRYGPRTFENVKDSDGTALFGDLDSPGSQLTLRCIALLKRPHIENPTAAELRRWCEREKIRVLNIAGNRESKQRGISLRVAMVVLHAFDVEP